MHCMCVYHLDHGGTHLMHLTASSPPLVMYSLRSKATLRGSLPSGRTTAQDLVRPKGITAITDTPTLHTVLYPHVATTPAL